MIKELIRRRVPQILGSYLVAGTSLVLFVEYLVDKYNLPIFFPTLALIMILGILPSVIIIAYFHGAPGKDEWTKIEKFGIPLNILFIGLLILLSYKSNIISSDLPKYASKRIFLSKILSSEFSKNNFDLLEVLKLVVDDPETRELLNKENVNLKKISSEDNSTFYDEIISNLHPNISSYELLNHYDYKDHSNSSGITVYDYNELSIYNFLKSSIGVGENMQVIFDQYYSGSIF